MKRKIVYVLITLIFGFMCLVVGMSASVKAGMEAQNALILHFFGDDTVSARQGLMTGIVVYSTGNETLIETWEELCSDIIREYADKEIE